MTVEKLLADLQTDLQIIFPTQKIQIEQEVDRLYILLESSPSPCVTETLRSIAPILQALDRNQDCYVYGRELGDQFTSWQRKFHPRPLTNLPLNATLHSPEVVAAPAEELDIQIERIIICGLGSLGQHCLYALKRFSSDDLEVKVTAIDRHIPKDCEFEGILSQLDRSLILGDCRRDQFLDAAGIRDCQAILIVTSDDN
ncbi:MAG: NAD-binding protein [Alkalinema sp. CAN_BIN05]|nr:NAD-binding protein [Alkalinema sp. CAN_BIN05]